jgi:hypothetical protein
MRVLSGVRNALLIMLFAALAASSPTAVAAGNCTYVDSLECDVCIVGDCAGLVATMDLSRSSATEVCGSRR